MKINKYKENTVSSMRHKIVYKKTHNHIQYGYQNIKITVWLGKIF